MADKIKVHVAYDYPEGPFGESLWASRINSTTAKVDNIPFFTNEFTLGDLVEINAQNKIVRVIERVARTRHGKYEVAESRQDQEKQWATVSEHLRRYDIPAELGVPGLFGVAVPNDISDDRTAKIFAECEVLLTMLPRE